MPTPKSICGTLSCNSVRNQISFVKSRRDSRIARAMAQEIVGSALAAANWSAAARWDRVLLRMLAAAQNPRAAA